MPTLHIEHAIVDFDLWKAAFDRFADRRVVPTLPFGQVYGARRG